MPQASGWPFGRVKLPRQVPISVYQELSDLLGQVPHTQDVLSFGDAAPMLPALPGLIVENVGHISLPLRQDNAVWLERQAQQCRGNLWLLYPNQFKMTNPEWAKGIEQLCGLCAERLGYKDIGLSPVMTMMLLFGEGGRLEDQQAQDPIGCVAKLTVLLPSCYSGGDLVVHEEAGLELFRYTLGKEDGTAAFRAHYAVYSSGEYRAVEEVTSGYRLVAVYALCLPKGAPCSSRRESSRMLRSRVAEAIRKLKGECGGRAARMDPEANTTISAEKKRGDDPIIALMLINSYKTSDIKCVGWKALSGLDHGRFRLLRDANSILPVGDGLIFYIACLRYKRAGNSSESHETNIGESVSWYSISGEKLGHTDSIAVKWTEKLHFLNPETETVDGLWGYSNASLDRRHGEQSSFAIVAWPVTADAKNSLTLIRGVTAIWLLELRKTMILLCHPATRPSTGHIPLFSLQRSQLSRLRFYRQLAKTVAESGDLYLVEKFFSKYFVRLQEKDEILPLLAEIVRKFGWDDVGASFLSSISDLPSESRMGLALHLADMVVDKPAAHKRLTMFAVERARSLCGSLPETLAYSCHRDLLWKHAMVCENPQVLIDVASLFKAMDGKLLGPVVDYFMKTSLPKHHASFLLPVASTRRQWLLDRVNDIMTPFTWEIPDLNFPDAAAVVKYLQGPSTALVIRGFRSLLDAQARASLLRQKIKAPVDIKTEGNGQNASVRISKTGGAHDPRANEIQSLLAQLERIGGLVSSLAAMDAAYHPSS